MDECIYCGKEFTGGGQYCSDICREDHAHEVANRDEDDEDDDLGEDDGEFE